VVDVRKVGYLLVLALLIGVGMVYLGTAHMQSVYELTRVSGQEQHLRQGIWEQQVELSARTESPRAVREQIARLGLMLSPGGITETADPLLDQLARGECVGLDMGPQGVGAVQ
jgi:hypothetical protein